MKKPGKRSFWHKVVNHLSVYVYATFSYVVPKKKRFIVFRPFHNQRKFSGNIKALLLYAHENHDALDLTLVTTDTQVQKEAQNLGLHVKHSSIGIFWATLRAQHIITDSYTMLLRIGDFSIVQLWHGVGFKNIGLLNENINQSARRCNILRKMYAKYQLIIATSEVDKIKQDKSFGVKITRITGYPRNDVFFREVTYFDRLKKEHGLEDYAKIITYAPTFRDYKTRKPFSDRFWKELEDYLSAKNAVFIIKKHPWDLYFDVPSQYKNIVDVSGKIEDIQELLVISDILITDYSSVATDFALTGNPILTYAYDLDQYKENCRSIYYDLENILPQPFIQEEEELLSILKDKDYFEKAEVKQSYVDFKNLFHYYCDGNSSKRVMDEILKL